MTDDLSALWVSVWSRSTRGFTAMPINDALREINQAIVNEREPDRYVMAVLPTLEDCLAYNRSIKRMMKKSVPEKVAGVQP